MILDNKPYTFDRVFRLFTTIIISAGVLWLMNYLSDVLIPFAVAFLMAYLLNPLVNRVQRVVKNRVAAVFAALVLIMAVCVLALLVLVPVVARELTHISELVRRVAQDADLTQRAVLFLPAGVWEQIREVLRGENIQQYLTLIDREHIWALVKIAGKKLLPGVWQVIYGAASVLFAVLGLFVILLYLVFLLLDYERATTEWSSLLPSHIRETTLDFLQDFNNAMNRYFRAQALVAFLVGVLFSIGFWLIGLPMALLLGMFVGLLNMVPYLQIIGLLPAALLAMMRFLETGGNPGVILGLTLLVFAVVQVIQDSLLTPRIMGKATGLSPAMILLSVSIWGKLLGLLGLIVALPMTCLLLAYYRRLVASAEAGAAVQS